MINNIGKVAEYLVLSELISRDLEAYRALSFLQEDYDITVIRKDLSICRVQVKATDLQNKSTNNSISNLEKKYDVLILVVFDESVPHYYLLTREEVGDNFSQKKPGTMYVSESEKGTYKVKGTLKKHINKWQKVSATITAEHNK